MAQSQKGTAKEQIAPFASLLAVSSLVLALLLVAGFSYRWTYFYNFGLRDLALQVPAQSIAINALELIRTPRDAVVTFSIVVLPFVALNVALFLLVRYLPRSARSLGLENRLVSDSLRAIVLIYSAYWAGSQSGWEKFKAHVVESASNTLPTVTAVLTAGSPDNALPFSCKPGDWDTTENTPKALPSLIGAPNALRELREGLACNTPNSRSWRMLYRDEKFVYLFATGSGAGRPLTVVLPNTDRVVLILGVATNASTP
jgi:hypothetical protein